MSPKLKSEMKKIAVALVIFFALMIVEKSGAAAPVMENRLINLILYLIPYLIVGYPVLRKAFLGIKNRQLFDESFLMTLASLGAFVTGQNEEAAAVMLFYQVGEWFQSYAVGRSRESITELMNIAPEFANLEHEDGSVETIDPDDVEEGNILVIRPGEKIPVDSVVISGESMINTAALTGESVPRSARPGTEVISGCINGEGLLRVRAQKDFEDSTVTKILEMVETASEKKSHTENFITRFARYYTPIVVCAALALAIIPSLITGKWLTWIYRACTFLVISCPCALVISVPLAFFGGIGAASKNGMLVKGSNYLELLDRLDTIVSDKTGTLTEGCFRVTEVIPAEGVDRMELLRCAAYAEGLSTHPIAVSIHEELERMDPEAAAKGIVPEDTDNVSGQGLISKVDGRTILVGNEKLLKSHSVPLTEIPTSGNEAATVCYVAELISEKESRFLGTIYISDKVKENALRFVPAMKKAGVRKIVMLTGDRSSVADAVAKELGIDETYSELLPQDKVARVEELLREVPEGKSLAFIGDGINDAPVLTRADIGIAMGSMGSDAAIEAADVVIMDDDLMRIPQVTKIAHGTLSISKENIVFALAVKILILILGALGIANMWAAVFADVGVAVLCILNSMRLITIKKTI